MKLLGTIIDVRSCVRMGWVGDDFWYPSVRNPPTPSSHSEIRKKPIYFD
jgi:hypothetical protein